MSWDCRWVNFDKYIQSYGPWFTLEIGFRSLSLAFLYRFSSNLAWELILGRSVLGLQMGKFRQICTELWSLIYVMELVLALYLWHFFTDFLQTLYESLYWEGVSWDCRCVNFDKYVQSYGPWYMLEIGFRSLSFTFLYRFSSNFAWDLILERSDLGLQMGKFWQICTELWPLIYVRNWFSLSIFGISLPIFFKLFYLMTASKLL